jgi:hypothetical protein
MSRIRGFVQGVREKISGEPEPPQPEINILTDPRATAPLPPLIHEQEDTIKRTDGIGKVAIRSLMSWIAPPKKESASKPWHGDDIDTLKKVVRNHIRIHKLADMKAQKKAFLAEITKSEAENGALVTTAKGVVAKKKGKGGKGGKKGKGAKKGELAPIDVPAMGIQDIHWHEIEKLFCDIASSTHQRTASECYQMWGDIQNTERLRVLAPDGEEVFFTEPEHITTENTIVEGFRRQPSKCTCVELFKSGSGLGSPYDSMEHLFEATQWSRIKSAKLHLGKARLVPKLGSKINPKRGSSARVPLALRGISVQHLEAFHNWSTGSTSKSKLDSIVSQVPPDLSYAEWVLGDRQQSWAPAVVVIYSWDLDWDYLVNYLKASFTPETKVWIDVVACNQQRILLGDTSELEQMPHVIDYIGQAIVMPGSMRRLWCQYEVGLSLRSNNQVVYCLHKELLSNLKLDGLLAEDKKLLSEGNAQTLMTSNDNIGSEADREMILRAVEGFGGAANFGHMILSHFSQCGPVLFELTERQKKRVRKNNPQYHVLKQFFLALGGSGWRRKENWMSKHPIGTWYGVRANSAGNIVSIELNNNLCVGKIPNAINKLKDLVALSLQDNCVTGQVPVTMVSLRRLRMLNVLGNPGLRMDQVLDSIRRCNVTDIHGKEGGEGRGIQKGGALHELRVLKIECAEGEHFRNNEQRALLRDVLPHCGVWFHDTDYPDLGPGGVLDRCTVEMLDGSTSSKHQLRRRKLARERARVATKFGEASGIKLPPGVDSEIIKKLYANQLTKAQRCATTAHFT